MGICLGHDHDWAKDLDRHVLGLNPSLWGDKITEGFGSEMKVLQLF